MAANDPLELGGIDHIECYVGNARQATHYYEWGFGFHPVAYRGPETGTKDRASYVLGQGSVRLVLTTPLGPEGPIAEHIHRHGDGVRDIALRVRDAAAAFEAAVARGARAVDEPVECKDDDGVFQRASIATYGDTIHSFVSRDGYDGAFAPGYVAAAPSSPIGLAHLPAPGLTEIDHVVGNVELGKMDEWVDFYERVLGFSQLAHFSDEAISTEYSALMSKVVWDGVGRVKFPLNEPAAGRRKSQIDEYLEFYRGPGAQHIAISVDDILVAVAAMRARGVQFMATPDTYYEELRGRFADLDLDIDDLARHAVLADRDEEGYLLQIFSRMVQDRPTVFFELIERHGSRGFGEGNFKALFVAIEREQEARGNL
jgi:4-hydroxyphenylpyruvate dioxygenase